MVIKTTQKYLKSLETRELKLYLFGELVKEPASHAIIKPSVNSAAMTYELANIPKCEEFMTALKT